MASAKSKPRSSAIYPKANDKAARHLSDFHTECGQRVCPAEPADSMAPNRTEYPFFDSLVAWRSADNCWSGEAPGWGYTTTSWRPKTQRC